MTFLVTITETLSRTITVDVASEDDAIEEIRQKYKSGKIVLDADDFVEVFFKVKNG